MSAANIIFLFFKCSAARFTRLPLCNSSSGILSGEEMCQNVPTPLPSAAFLLCPLTPRGMPQAAPPFIHQEGSELWGKWKNKSSKEKFALPNPASSFLPLARAAGNITPSQTRMQAHWNFFKVEEPYSVLMPLQITVGPLTEGRKSE